MTFDRLEMANQPTLRNFVFSYYRIMKDTRINENNHTIIEELKTETRYCLDKKYFTSILQIYCVGKYLDPSFKPFFFVSDYSYLEEQKEEVREDLHILASDIIE